MAKEKIKNDYENYNEAIERIVQEEIDKIRQETAKIKKEAEKIGEEADKSKDNAKCEE